MEKELIAVCGLHCGVCPIYLATKDRALAEKIASKRGVKPEDLHCLGCRSEKGNIPLMGPPTCETYVCCVNDKKLEFCFQCEEFPCLKLAPCSDRASEIPHNTKIYSLLRIQKVGLENWDKEAKNIRKLYFSGKKKRPGDKPSMD